MSVKEQEAAFKNNNIEEKENWSKKYFPQNLEELKLSVTKAKIDEIIKGLNQSTFLFFYGSSGSCKTCSLKVCCKELNYPCVEWLGEDFEFEDFLFTSCYPSLFLTSPNKRVIFFKSIPEINGKEILYQALSRIKEKKLNLILVYIYTLTGEGKSKLSLSQLNDIFGIQDLQPFIPLTLIHFLPVAKTRIKKTMEYIYKEEKISRNNTLISEEGGGDLRNILNNNEFFHSSSSSRGGKDESLDFLHGIGKLLRGNKTKEEKFSYETIAKKCGLEVKTLTSFVFENFYKYASVGNLDLKGY